jgi:deoxyribonuclease-4
LILGAHESIAGGLSRAFERAEGHGARSFQIFTKSARSWAAPPLDPVEQRAFRAEARRTGIPAVAHGSYLANLASDQPLLREKSIASVLEELRRCEALGVTALIIHPGAHARLDEGIRLIASAINEVHAQTARFKAKIALEVTAGQGNCIGWRFEHLAEIIAQVDAPSRLRVCLDTCHMYSAGYDISTPRGYDTAMRELEECLGTDRVHAIHLNDSKKPLGSRVDRHEEIGLGTLGLGPFRELVNDPRFEKAIGVLETPNPERYAESLKQLHSLHRGT